MSSAKIYSAYIKRSPANNIYDNETELIVNLLFLCPCTADHPGFLCCSFVKKVSLKNVEKIGGMKNLSAVETHQHQQQSHWN